MSRQLLRPGRSAPASRATWWPLAVLVAINVLNFYDRQVAGAVVEPVRKEFLLPIRRSEGSTPLYHALWPGRTAAGPPGRQSEPQKTSRRRHCHLGPDDGQRPLDQQLFLPCVCAAGRGRGRSHRCSHGDKLDRRSLSPGETLQTAGAFHAGRSRGRSVELFLQRPIAQRLGLAHRHAGGRGAGAAADSVAAHAA